MSCFDDGENMPYSSWLRLNTYLYDNIQSFQWFFAHEKMMICPKYFGNWLFLNTQPIFLIFNIHGCWSGLYWNIHSRTYENLTNAVDWYWIGNGRWCLRNGMPADSEWRRLCLFVSLAVIWNLLELVCKNSTNAADTLGWLIHLSATTYLEIGRSMLDPGACSGL